MKRRIAGRRKMVDEIGERRIVERGEMKDETGELEKMADEAG